MLGQLAAALQYRAIGRRAPTRKGPMPHIDIPALADFKALASIKGDNCVSLYVPTVQTLQQLKDAGVDKRRVECFNTLTCASNTLASPNVIWNCQKKPNVLGQSCPLSAPRAPILSASDLPRPVPTAPKPSAAKSAIWSRSDCHEAGIVLNPV